MIPRTLLLAGMVVGVALANGCGRTEMETLVHVTGNGRANPSTGGASGSAAGPCGEATCLTSLFQTCVPEGSCSLQGGASPSASFNTGCYANGVTVSYLGSYNGTNVTGNLSTGRTSRRAPAATWRTPANAT